MDLPLPFGWAEAEDGSGMCGQDSVTVQPFFARSLFESVYGFCLSVFVAAPVTNRICSCRSWLGPSPWPCPALLS